MQSAYRAKVLQHLAMFHRESVIKHGPDRVLNMIWWRCKAGTRRIAISHITNIIKQYASRSCSINNQIVDIVVDVLSLVAVRVAEDSNI